MIPRIVLIVVSLDRMRVLVVQAFGLAKVIGISIVRIVIFGGRWNGKQQSRPINQISLFCWDYPSENKMSKNKTVTPEQRISRFKDDFGAGQAIDITARGIGGDEIDDCWIDEHNVISLCQSDVQELGIVDVDDLTHPVELVERQERDETTIVSFEGMSRTDHVTADRISDAKELFEIDSDAELAEHTSLLKDGFFEHYPIKIDDPHTDMFVIVAPYCLP